MKDLVTPKCTGLLSLESTKRNYHPKENHQHFVRGKKALPGRKPVANSDGKAGSALAPSKAHVLNKAESAVLSVSRHPSRLTKALCQESEAVGSKARLRVNVEPAYKS